MSEQTSRVCVYCKETVTPANDPFHVHGHNECLCGVEPRHNSHPHDGEPEVCVICGQPVNSDRHGYGRHLPDGISREQEHEKDSGAELAAAPTIPDVAETETASELEAQLRRVAKLVFESKDLDTDVKAILYARLPGLYI